VLTSGICTEVELDLTAKLEVSIEHFKEDKCTQQLLNVCSIPVQRLQEVKLS